jgi:hypothetical protein
VWGELAHAISRFCTKLEGQNRPALELAAATYVMRGVHDKLFLFLCSEHEAGDAVLARLMDRLAPALTQVAKEALTPYPNPNPNVMRGVHDKLFLFLCSEHEAGDAVLARLMDRLAPALTQVAKEARPTVSRFDTTHLMFWLLSWVRRGRRHRRLKPEDAASTDQRRGH